MQVFIVHNMKSFSFKIYFAIIRMMLIYWKKTKKLNVCYYVQRCRAGAGAEAMNIWKVVPDPDSFLNADDFAKFT